MKTLFDQLSVNTSRMTTKLYSTSFSLGIKFLNKEFHNSIYAIYGFVRLADEIVDSFDDYNQTQLLSQFKDDYEMAILEKISLNPILNSFQRVVHRYNIDKDLVTQFLYSMTMDLSEGVEYNQSKYETYILGSAEVVGLMCLKVFVNGDDVHYKQLKPYAKKLGAAFQKINFLRDLSSDYYNLGRIYFPNINIDEFDDVVKQEIQNDIQKDFEMGYVGIKKLPLGVRGGVFLTYTYYVTLLEKIKSSTAEKILKDRVRVSNSRKFLLMIKCFIINKLNWL